MSDIAPVMRQVHLLEGGIFAKDREFPEDRDGLERCVETRKSAFRLRDFDVPEKAYDEED